MIKFIFYFSFCLANTTDEWINNNANILKQDIKSVSFQLTTDSKFFDKKNDGTLSGKITIGKNKKFRYEMDTRTVVSDGKVWKSYDERTDQIFMHEPDREFEKAIFSWVRLKKIKSLPVILETDGGYRIPLLGKLNDVRVYFNPGSCSLQSIVITQGEIKTEIFDVILSSEDSLSLEIGQKSSISIDFR